MVTLPLLGRFGELPTAVNFAQAAVIINGTKSMIQSGIEFNPATSGAYPTTPGLLDG
jgi:hypothetical protein